MSNEMADVDLDQRNFVIDGVNGFDLTQLQDIDNSPEDQVELQTEGVPVLVHPESMLLPDVTQSGASSMVIFPTGTLTIGADEVSAVQTRQDGDGQSINPDEDDSIVLQVNGVPVTVNPESLLLPDVNQSGAASMRIFPQGTLTLGTDDVSVA